MSLLILKFVPCLSIPRAEDEDMFCYSPFSVTAAEWVRHREDPGLEEKSIQAICFRSQLNSQQALWLPEPFLKLHDISPLGGLHQTGV